MAYTGTGTQADPYIVDNWDDFLLVCNLTTSTYIKWADSEDKVVDFNEINPQGYDSTIECKGNIDFNGWEFRNLASSADIVISFTGAGVNNHALVCNLKITNARHIRITAGGTFLKEANCDLDNISLSYEFDYGNGVSCALDITGTLAGNKDIPHNRIAVYAYGMVRDNLWRFTPSRTRTIRYSRFHCEVQARNCDNICGANLVDCVVSGELTIDNDNVTQVLVGASNSTLNVIRLQSNKTIRYNGAGISLKVDRDYTGDIVRPNTATWDEHVLLVNTAQARTQQEAILAAGFPLHKAVDD
jgi:hypothetical protein